MTAEIAESYLDVWGNERRIDPAVRAALEKAMGPARAPARVALEGGRCWQPELLEHGGRVWGFMVQLYGLRSARNWGVGDFGDLRALIEFATARGAGIVGVNPLHATQGSPYSPSSRHAVDYLYLDVEALPEFARSGDAQRLVRSAAFRKRLGQLRSAELVDYAGVRAAKLEVLELLFRVPKRAVSVSEGERGYALFEALREKLGGGWQGWPAEYWDPSGRHVRRFARQHRDRVRFHEYVCSSARAQLEAVQRHALSLGMPIGLYVDLALGADRGGAEVWSDQAAYASDVSVGAPPDDFNPKGQDWGLPPYSPRALRAAAYKPFIELLRANMPEGGALRMDHVMALSRLWWLPAGFSPEQGGYASYPFEELLAALAQESRNRRCLVIGEDLGTVSPELRGALNAAGVLSYRPLFFEKRGDGEFVPPEGYPADALVCVSTHDLPTWRGYWTEHDLDLRVKIGLSVDAQKERGARKDDQERLARALAHEGFDTSAHSAHAFIARTPCKLALVQPEDVLEVLEQANLPGTVEQHPNWRRKLPLELEKWASDARFASLSEAMAERSVFAGRPLRVPAATYRVQFHAGFRFADATALVPYLAKLGITHLYASPFLNARPGSQHGYDVIDHAATNPEIGTEADLEVLMQALKDHGMGLVVDLVPNHMGVLHADNAWWLDVLEHGRASRYARYFDIDWTSGKLLLPVLGRHYGEALEAGELRLEKSGARWSVRYFDHRFPLNAKSTRRLKPNRKENEDPLALHRILEQQHYRLAYWRVASDEINYRRFFEITDLAGLRVEDPQVFEATHAFVLRLAKKGGVDGLRVDHPDGLADPKQYLERLNERFVRPWIVVEKILADHEALPDDWPVQGETGYRFANLLTGLFIDSSAESRFDLAWQRFSGERRTFAEIAAESRHLIMNTTLAAELHMLSNRLARIAAGNRRTRDYTVSGLRKALAEIAAHFPVYRTYVSPRGVSETDRRWIEWAVGAARRASHAADPGVFDFVKSVITLEAAPPSGVRRDQMLRFAMRFQQFTAPVVAKGVEDTAFYRYNRLIALNEVGGNPARFGVSLKAFHAESQARARRWPATLLGSSTHDTKRSEDVRARLGVLSEIPGQWRLWLRRWSLLNRSFRTPDMPSRADEYHFYQALIGIWPGAVSDDLVERLKAYMLKAVREAKLRTSWINPDADYEQALERFVTGSLSHSIFIDDLNQTVPRLARLGTLVGLSQALLKVASPGVADYYQGSELWDFSLVDPDNRRPVDYPERIRLLDEESHPKLRIIRKGLELRRRYPALFSGGKYEPLYADGAREENVIAFSLKSGARRLIAVAPRLFASFIDSENPWGDAAVQLPDGRFENVLTRKDLGGGRVPLAGLLADFPVALLITK